MSDDRLTPLDASFLDLEDDASHMHVASVMLFAGDPPPYDDLAEAIERRLHLVPRYRQRLAFVPFGQDRPRWVDDPAFNLRYHVRHTALPAPGTEAELKQLASRVFSQQLDRDKPLWELWLVEGLDGGRFALLAKTHHALVDGISGVDIVTVLFDTQPEPAAPPAPAEPWLPRPLPSRAQLLAEALRARADAPRRLAGAAARLVASPEAALASTREVVGGVGSLVGAALRPAPPSPYNGRIGPHRRFTWTRASLDDVKAIKNSLGGTVNDVVLAVVAGALNRHLKQRGIKPEGLELRALVPVSVRADAERGALGNRVAAMAAPLPVWCEDPQTRLEIVSRSMSGLKESGQAVGAEAITRLSGFAPPTVMSQAARLAARQRFFNLVVTNVPGPQFSLYLLGRELLEPLPMVPLSPNAALGIAIMSYRGRINIGLVGDYDMLSDLEELAACADASLAELAGAAGVRLSTARPAPRRRARQPART
jgi:diacylglycerol O-acyltransferase / wax synthase